MTSGRVLVTDGQWNKTVAVTRSLGRHGLQVTVGETSRFAPAMFSRHAQHRLVYPSPLAQPEAFVHALTQELRRVAYDMVVPTELSTLLLLSPRRQELLAHTRFPFAPDAVLQRAARKWPVAQAAMELGLAVPATRFLPAGQPVDPASLAQEPGLPLVLKADLSEGGRGMHTCQDAAQLRQALEAVAAAGVDYVAQARLPPGGQGWGVSLLLDEAQRPLARFTHRRLREYPLSGGPSSYRESCAHPEAEAMALTLLGHLGWSGVAMVEFKTDPRDGRPRLLEVNPRFWGSLPLAMASGVDFPVLLHAWAMGRPLPRPPQVYGRRLRNLLPGDLLHLWAARGRVDAEFWRPGAAGDDLLCWDDPAPVVGRLLSPLALLTDPHLRAVVRRRGCR